MEEIGNIEDLKPDPSHQKKLEELISKPNALHTKEVKKVGKQERVKGKNQRGKNQVTIKKGKSWHEHPKQLELYNRIKEAPGLDGPEVKKGLEAKVTKENSSGEETLCRNAADVDGRNYVSRGSSSEEADRRGSSIGKASPLGERHSAKQTNKKGQGKGGVKVINMIFLEETGRDLIKERR
nr:hypothetical protein [Tanacetum cinerariifolium]